MPSVPPVAPARRLDAWLVRVAWPLVVLAALVWCGAAGDGNRALAQTATRVYLPFAARGPGAPPPAIDEDYATIPIEGLPETRPAGEHPDLNLAVRGYVAVSAFRGLVDYDGATDPHAPQLAGLLGRAPDVRGTFQVYDWDWGRMARGAPITTFPVTLVTLEAGGNAIVRVPDSGRTIGDGYQVLVLYAEAERITLKYTREDNVVEGYTLHLEGVRVAPELLSLYRQADAAGRGRLPALRAGQALGWASGEVIGVAIRDRGTFLDPRSRKDWWRGY